MQVKKGMQQNSLFWMSVSQVHTRRHSDDLPTTLNSLLFASNGSISFKPAHPPSFRANLSGICCLISKLWQMPHSGASLCVQMPHGGLLKECKMTNLWNKKTIIAHKLMYFYRNCNSSNCFLTTKTATFSSTLHVLLSVISRSQVEMFNCANICIC